jgi:hypothetical protein
VNRIVSRRGWLLATLGSFLIVGCGKNDGRVQVVKTTGKLEWPGHRVLGLMVVLHPLAADAPKLPVQPTGVVQTDGTFTINCYEMSDGAPIGEYVVTIREAPLPDTAPKTIMPPAKYLDPKFSPLRATIEKKSVNELPPLVIN